MIKNTLFGKVSVVEDFPDARESTKSFDYCCPKCSYSWSGMAIAGRASAPEASQENLLGGKVSRKSYACPKCGHAWEGKPREGANAFGERKKTVVVKSMDDVPDKPPYRVPSMAEILKIPWNGFKVASSFSGCGGSWSIMSVASRSRRFG